MEPAELEAVAACPLCGCRDRSLGLRAIDHLVTGRSFDLNDCKDCGFRFTDPRPRPEDIGRYYFSTAYISHTNAGRTLSDRLYRFARERAIRSKHAQVHRYVSAGRVLDIGCGTGEFLGYMKGRGYFAAGVEPSMVAREQAREKHQLDVFAAIDQVRSGVAFQVVTLWHVLEHLHEPSGTLRAVSSLLSADGILVVAVPTRECWDRQHYGPLWAAWDVPRHLSHFRSSDLVRMLNLAGFQVIRTRRMWLDALYVSMLSERIKGRGSLSALGLGILIGVWSNLVSILTGRSASSALFIAKRSE